jgi:hypothetical protein
VMSSVGTQAMGAVQAGRDLVENAFDRSTDTQS